MAEGRVFLAPGHLIELEFSPPIHCFRQCRLILLVEDEVTHDQEAHLGVYERSVCVLGRTDDRLISNIGAGLYDYAITGQLFEFVD